MSLGVLQVSQVLVLAKRWRSAVNWMAASVVGMVRMKSLKIQSSAKCDWRVRRLAGFVSSCCLLFLWTTFWQIFGAMDKPTDGRTNGRMDDRWTDGRIGPMVDRLMDGQTNWQIDSCWNVRKMITQFDSNSNQLYSLSAHYLFSIVCNWLRCKLQGTSKGIPSAAGVTS